MKQVLLMIAVVALVAGCGEKKEKPLTKTGGPYPLVMKDSFMGNGLRCAFPPRIPGKPPKLPPEDLNNPRRIPNDLPVGSSGEQPAADGGWSAGVWCCVMPFCLLAVYAVIKSVVDAGNRPSAAERELYEALGRKPPGSN